MLAHIKHQERTAFHYQRMMEPYDDKLGVCIDSINKYYPFSYTIEECLEDYCIGVGLYFDHIQIGARLEEGNGYGQFYFYRMVLAESPAEPPPQRPPYIPLDPGVIETCYAWARRRNERGQNEIVITLGNGTIRILSAGASVQDNLKELCRLRGWTFVYRYICYAGFNCGDGYLRYRE